jgi:hypothetical protein
MPYGKFGVRGTATALTEIKAQVTCSFNKEITRKRSGNLKAVKLVSDTMTAQCRLQHCGSVGAEDKSVCH